MSGIQFILCNTIFITIKELFQFKSNAIQLFNCMLSHAQTEQTKKNFQELQIAVSFQTSELKT